MINLDHNATTPLCPAARDAMLPLMEAGLGNPSAIHAPGRLARAAIDGARDKMASLLGVKPHEIIFTAGGTESCNLALLGLARRHRSPGRNHLVTAATEHHAVLHAMRALVGREEFTLTEVGVDVQGRVDPVEFAAAIRPETILASVMLANNETGVIQPIEKLAALCRERGVLFHTDAVQALGKIPCRPLDLGVDALSITAHKFHGPHGAGLLWLRSGIPIDPIQHGGFHENNRRPGTENASSIAGLAVAAELAIAEVAEGKESLRQAALRESLWEGISRLAPFAVRHASDALTLSNTLSVSFPGCDGEALIMGLDLEGIAVSSGSACMVGSVMPSHVLMAMGIPEQTARATVRLSLGRETTAREVEQTLEGLARVISRQIS